MIKLEKEFKINGHRVIETFTHKGLTIYEREEKDYKGCYVQYLVNSSGDVIFSFHSDSPIAIKGCI